MSYIIPASPRVLWYFRRLKKCFRVEYKTPYKKKQEEGDYKWIIWMSYYLNDTGNFQFYTRIRTILDRIRNRQIVRIRI